MATRSSRQWDEANVLAMFDIQAHRHPNGQTENMESGDDIDDGHDEGGNAIVGTKCGILTLRRVAFNHGGDCDFQIETYKT